jgi:hypothetical protein
MEYLLLVTFSLRNPLKNYESFLVTLRGNARQWCHYIEQTMIVLTPYSQSDLYHKLIPHIETNDSLLIVPMPDATQLSGMLPKEAWEWIHAVSMARKPPSFPPLSSLSKLK